MIDMHSHVFPNIDDGARSIDETFELIREAKNVGFEGIVLTSHYMEKYYETDVKEREVLLDIIRKNLQENGIDIKLYLGNEIYITDNIMKLLEERRACSINDTSYVLFEMPLNIEPLNLYDVVYEILQNKLIPILAHPERYSFIQKEPELVYDLIEKGVLMQANYGSIIGQYGKKTQFILKKFLENNMIHFLGTDVHRRSSIYPKIPEILETLEGIIGFEKLNELTTQNPKLVLNNKRITIEEPHTIELTLKEKIMMNILK